MYEHPKQIWRFYALKNGNWITFAEWTMKREQATNYLARIVRDWPEYPHVMAWPFFAMEGAALLGGETRLPVRQFASDESAGVWRCWQCRNANFDEWPKCDTCGAGRD